NIFADNVLFTSPGDTYVQVFQFARITPKDIDIADDVKFIDWGEIVSVPCETTVDLKNRNDLSIGGWDLKFLPKDEDFHQYNKVYSQNNILSLSRASEYNIKKNRDFDTRIIASKLKYNGELYDNWLTLSVNDTMDLEGTYGGITNLIKFKD